MQKISAVFMWLFYWLCRIKTHLGIISLMAEVLMRAKYTTQEITLFGKDTKYATVILFASIANIRSPI